MSSVQTLPSLQTGGGPPLQTPPPQVSPVVQASPSSQAAVLFEFWQPRTGSQESSVQGFASSQFNGEAPTVRVLAAQHRVTGIIGTGVAIVAAGRRTAHADTAAAGVARGTGITIVAGCGVVRILAAQHRITEVCGTDICIITARRCTAYAGAAAAGVRRGAGIAVIAGSRIVRVLAAQHRIAGIIGTGVSIVTVRRRTAHTGTGRAGVGRSTGITVVARSRVVRVLAAKDWIAGIIGTGVTVIAV
jgi:hypothetical protein